MELSPVYEMMIYHLRYRAVGSVSLINATTFLLYAGSQNNKAQIYTCSIRRTRHVAGLGLDRPGGKVAAAATVVSLHADRKHACLHKRARREQFHPGICSATVTCRCNNMPLYTNHGGPASLGRRTPRRRTCSTLRTPRCSRASWAALAAAAAAAAAGTPRR